jgi:hypothetical protein
MQVTLRNWLDNGWLIEHKTNSQEIADLLQVADRDLKDCETPGLSADWQLSIAYNAALQTASAALAACGFRPGRDAHHHRVIQSLRFTIGANLDLINQFDQYRKKRNMGGYDMAGMISQKEADGMKALAKRLRKEIEEWLRKHHPRLME